MDEVEVTRRILLEPPGTRVVVLADSIDAASAKPSPRASRN
jgi:hypothetical protein